MDISDILDNIAGSISYDDAIVLLFVGVWVFFCILFLIGIVINHILLAIPLYIMADKAGYAHPFLAFIPFANYYLVHILPMKEYNYIGIFKTYERGKGFLLYLIVKYILPFGMGFVAMFISFLPFLGFLASFVMQFVTWIGYAASGIAKAIMVADLLQTYMKKSDKGLTIFLGILSVFVPLAFPICCYALCNKEPEFGFGNYYCPVTLPEEE